MTSIIGNKHFATDRILNKSVNQLILHLNIVDKNDINNDDGDEKYDWWIQTNLNHKQYSYFNGGIYQIEGETYQIKLNQNLNYQE